MKKLNKFQKTFKKLVKKKGLKKILAPKSLIGFLSVVVFALVVYQLVSFLVVATVNGRPVSRLWLDRQLEKQSGRQVLENQITKMLILQEGKRRGVSPNSAETQAKLDELKSQIEAQGGDFEVLLTSQALTINEVKEQIELQLLIEKLLGTDIEIGEEQIAEYFEQNKELFEEGTTLEEKKEEIGESLFQQELSSRFVDWTDQLREEAKIKYLLEF